MDNVIIIELITIVTTVVYAFFVMRLVYFLKFKKKSAKEMRRKENFLKLYWRV